MPRYIFVSPGAVAGGAALGLTEYSTPDDQVTRRLTGVFVTPGTANNEIQLAGGGYTFAKLDAGYFETGNEMLELDEPFPATIKFAVNVVNHTGASFTPFITLRYEPGPGAGKVSGAT